MLPASMMFVLAVGGAPDTSVSEGALKTRVRPWHKKILCRRVTRAPVIDADLSDWDMKRDGMVINAQSLRRLGKVDGAWDGDKDSHAVVAVGYDDTLEIQNSN